MSSYIGHPGGLIELKRSAVAPVSPAANSTFDQTLGGRVVEYVGPRGRREWEVQASLAKTGAYAELNALSVGAFGPAPFVWLPRFAQVTNLLTPDASLLKPGTYSASIQQGGQGVTADGIRFGHSILPSGASVALGGCPVVQGVPVTASIYCTAGRVRLDWLDAGGSITNGPVSALASSPQGRVSVTAIPPATAVRCRIVVADSTQAELPALTFTDKSTPWAVGSGCEKASIGPLSETPRLQTDDYQYADISFTVREIG